MVSQKEHIQTLIAEIDSVLQRTSPRLPWVMSGEVAQQRQVLERVRNYLVALQQSFPVGEGMGQSAIGANPFAQEAYPGSQPSLMGGALTDMTPYQMMQSILQEVSYLRANLTPSVLNQPSMNQPQLTAELLQVLMSRLQENLTQQIAQTLDGLRNQPPAYGSQPMLSGGLPPVPVPPQYDQLQALRSRSDQMLVNLDSTLNVVFESLQRNIQAYQEALSQGLERMYNTGQQSEYTFKLLLDQLVQQLKERVKQEASSYLLSSQSVSSPTPQVIDPAAQGQTGGVESLAAADTSPPPISLPPSAVASAASPTSSPSFPYAGAELLSSEISGIDLSPAAPFEDLLSEPSPASITSLDSAIESWLQSVSLMNQGEESKVEDLSTSLPPLDLSDLDLGAIALDVPPMDLNVASVTIPESAQQVSSPPPIAPWSGSSSTLPPVQSAEAPLTEPILSVPFDQSTEDPNPLLVRSASDEDTADIDAALKLLEDLSAELESSASSISLEDAEAQLEQMLESTLVEEAEDQLAPLSTDAQDELDEFYQSLFGAETAQQTASSGELEESSFSSTDETASIIEPTPPVASAPVEVESTVTPVAEEAIRPKTESTSFEIDFSSPSIESLSALNEIGQAAETQNIPLFLDLPADLFAEPFESTINAENSIESEFIAEDVVEESIDLTTNLIISPEPEPTASDLFGDVSSLAASEFASSELEATASDLFGDDLELLTNAKDFASSEATASDLFEDVGLSTNLTVPAESELIAIESAALELDEMGSLTDLFQDVPTEAARSVPIDPPVIREIPVTSPTPLVVDSHELFADDLFSSESPQEMGEDQFTRAAPDEILLPDAARSEGSINLELDELTLSSLSEDLFSLEGTVGETRKQVSEFTLDDFAADVGAPNAPVSAPPSDAAGTVSSPPNVFYQASPEIGNLSIEGFSDLFGDAPPTSPSPVALPVNEPLPFTLEGTNTLFEDFAPAPIQANLNESSPFTLEGMDDLFGDAPVIEPVKSEPKGPNALTSPAQPSISSIQPTTAEEPFTLEGMDDLFGNLRSTSEKANSQTEKVNPQPVAPPPREIPPFKPELFNPGDVMEPIPNFSLEQLDNLFVESTASSLEVNSSVPISESTIAPTSSPTMADKQSLDAAFESLLGTPPPSSHSVDTPVQPVSQKKKTP